MALAPALDLRGPPAEPDHAPCNVDAEQALLGVLLYDNAAYERIGDRLLPAHFFEPLHGRLFEEIGRRIHAGQTADAALMVERFGRDAAFIEAGGITYLFTLTDKAPPAVRAADYAREVYDLALRRELIRIGGEIAHTAKAGDAELTARDQIEAAESQLFALAEQGSEARGMHPVDHYVTGALQAAAAAYQSDGAIVGVATGLIDLDRKLGGLHDTDFIVLGARPSMGKSSLAVNIAVAAARAGKPVGFFSLEMSGEQLSMRMMSDLSGISGDRIRRGDIRADEYSRLRDAGAEVSQLPIHIDDTGGLSIARLATRARRMKRRHGLSLVIVDYLQLLTTEGRRRESNRVQDVTEITVALKALAKDLAVPVLALSQLSRQVETREDKRPQLSDLRESGSIEQDADVVMFLYREAYYLGRSEPREETPEHLEWAARMDEVGKLAELNIAKQRHGPIGTVRLHFDEDTTKFSNLARERDMSNVRQPYPRDD